MRELPILFSAPMVRAILGGRKTVTRRVVKPQPFVDESGNFCWNGRNYGQDVGRRANVQAIASPVPSSRSKRVLCPYGAPGDRLWVRETHAFEHDVDGGEPPHADGRPVLRRPDDDVDGMLPMWTQPHYRATDPAPDLCCERPGCAQCRDHDMGPHWRPAIHMPRWASRITLEVTAVRVERLQDISDEQANAEGVPWQQCADWMGPNGAQRNFGPKDAFQGLWDSINGAGSWAVNPWVWVLEFKRIETEVPHGG